MERISESVLSFLLNATWQITLVALVACVCSRLLRNAAASLRHTLWVAALILSFALPLWGSLDFAGDTPRRIFEERISTSSSLEGSQSTTNSVIIPEVTKAKDSRPALGQLLQKRRQPLTAALSLSLMLFICYALFILYRLCALWRSWRQTTFLRQSAYEREMPGRMAAIAVRCRAALGLEVVPLLCSRKTVAPITIGAPRALIILPESFFQTQQDETLVSVLGHEMAHVARRDYALNLFYEFLVLPISFHPLAKFIKSQIDRTRELACDDLVTERLVEPKAYARALVRVATELVAPTGKAFTLGIFDADNLEERILKLTQKSRRKGARTRRLLALAAFSLLCLSSLTISTFSFELRVDDQFAGGGISRAALDESAANTGDTVSGPGQTRAQNQSGSTPQVNISQQTVATNDAQARAEQACEALRRRAVEAIPTLLAMLDDDRPTRLLQCWENSHWSPALATFKQASPGEQAAIALASMGNPAIKPLTNALSDANQSVRRNAAWAIGELTNMREDERADSVPPLISLLNDSDEWVRMAAVRALGEIKDERATERLLTVLSDHGWKVRELAAWALGEMKEERAVQTLCKLLLEDAEVEVRVTAAWALGEISDPRAAPFLNQALNDAETRVRDKARWALSEITDSDG